MANVETRGKCFLNLTISTVPEGVDYVSSGKEYAHDDHTES